MRMCGHFQPLPLSSTHVGIVAGPKHLGGSGVDQLGAVEPAVDVEPDGFLLAVTGCRWLGGTSRPLRIVRDRRRYA